MDYRHHRAGRDRHRRVVVGRLGRQQQRCTSSDESAGHDRGGDFAVDGHGAYSEHDRLRRRRFNDTAADGGTGRQHRNASGHEPLNAAHFDTKGAGSGLHPFLFSAPDLPLLDLGDTDWRLARAAKEQQFAARQSNEEAQ
jgi:hypothetical protein